MFKNVLKIALIIIAIFVVILIINTIRNYMIITDLQDKISQYQDSTNYSIKSVSTEKDGTIVNMEYYRKDNKQVVFLERNLNGKISKISMYDNGERTNTYTQTEDSKIAQLNRGKIMTAQIYNHLETENNWQTFLSCINSRIKLVDYKGRECYVIKGFMSATTLTSEGSEKYIDKETGIYVKAKEVGIVNEREYEFDKVEDSIFIEPDVSQYNIKEQ